MARRKRNFRENLMSQTHKIKRISLKQSKKKIRHVNGAHHKTNLISNISSLFKFLIFRFYFLYLLLVHALKPSLLPLRLKNILKMLHC